MLNSWIFSYTTTKQLDANLQELNSDIFPLFSAINDLKNQVNYNIYYFYDFISTGDANSLQKYYSSQEKIEVEIGNVSQYIQPDKIDFFNKAILQQRVDKLNLTMEEIVDLYQSNPSDPQLKNKILALEDLRNNFNQILENEIDINIQSKITENQTLINNKVHQITVYLITVVVLIITITVLLLIFMYYNITTPVNQITEAAIKFGKGKLTKINMDSKDELGILSNAFNKMVEDISATQKALQDELAKTKEIDKQKSEFLSIAAHQLRTPMSGLKWLLSLTVSGDLGKLTEKQKRLWQDGLENVDRMIKLINDFLDIAKIEQAKFQYKFESVKIREIVDDVVKLMKEKMKTKKIILNIKESNNIPAVSVDKEKIKIAFINLIDNSIKYSQAGSSIEIEITSDAKFVHISTIDHGYGIPAKDQKFIFTKFFRSSNIMKKETSLDSIGTGLGLFIVKDIITKHEGSISFKSEENKGTSFYIDLPIQFT